MKLSTAIDESKYDSENKLELDIVNLPRADDYNQQNPTTCRPYNFDYFSEPLIYRDTYIFKDFDDLQKRVDICHIDPVYALYFWIINKVRSARVKGPFNLDKEVEYFFANHPQYNKDPQKIAQDLRNYTLNKIKNGDTWGGNFYTKYISQEEYQEYQSMLFGKKEENNNESNNE